MLKNSDAHQDMIKQQTGFQGAKSHTTQRLLSYIAIAWALFQLWYASPLPFWLNFAILNDGQARAIHLSFAFILAFTVFPLHKNRLQQGLAWFDVLCAIAGAFCASYLLIYYQELSQRPGAPTQTDIIVAVTGVLLLLEATRRALGPPLSIVAGVFIAYIFLGPFMPDVISHGGASLAKTASHLWISSEGVFGIALGVSTSFVFLFVLFGALLDSAGAGNYFIKTAFALLGHFRGGPAKAAVMASGMTGLISGSSIANVVTTGTFTIPLMKRMGLSAEKAGAVEVASSCYGQIMPPIMGAAAFLMVEYVGISYVEVIKHAFVPAIAAYLTFLYIMHLEALKAGLEGIATAQPLPPVMQRVLRAGIIVSSLIILAGITYYSLQFIQIYAGSLAIYMIATLILGSYLLLTYIAAQSPLLEQDNGEEITVLPLVSETVKTGLYFLLPVVILIWCLMVEQLSPGLSAFYATIFLIFILLTQPLTLGFFRHNLQPTQQLKEGYLNLVRGLEEGAQNMIGIAVATAAAGIVVGTVTLTGLGPVMTEFVEWVSGGNLIVMLIMIAFISLILGMGLPTTANYIVVSSLMAPVVVNLAAQHGLAVPLIAVHLYVFYFGIMADITPPVGLAAFAASAISKADPIKTGIQAFKYAMLTAILPFMFIFNTDIILYQVNSWLYATFIFFTTLAAMVLFASAIHGYFLIFNKKYESILLIACAFIIMRPEALLDLYIDKYEQKPGNQIEALAEQESSNTLRLTIAYENLSGLIKEKLVLLPLPKEKNAERLQNAGVEIIERNDKTYIDMVEFDSAAQQVGLDFDQEIISVAVENERPNKYFSYLLAALLLAAIIASQNTRRHQTKI